MVPDIATIPTRPGVYLFKGAGDRIIYVGKAKNLRNRLRSYFQDSARLDPRKAAMVREVKDLSVVATDNELEAWILEANLIKQHRPRYNIVLRDDKNYPYIRVTVTEPWPRVEVVRRLNRDGNLYFGPYIPAQAVHQTMDFIRRSFLVRTCSGDLEKPRKPCIQHQMGNCLAPCGRRVSPEDYRKMVDEIVLFLKGEKDDLISRLEERMLLLSEEMRYEEAARVRDSIPKLRQAFASQKIIAPELGDLDVIGLYRDPGRGREVAVHLLFIRNGIMTGTRNFMLDNLLDSGQAEVLGDFIELFYTREIIPAPVLVVPFSPPDKAGLISWFRARTSQRIRIEVPRHGKKADLLRMAQENAGLHYAARRKGFDKELLDRLAARFELGRAPGSIGAFDISTLHGRESVGAFVWWENGDFRKDRYRHVKIRTVEGLDDYAMLHEAVTRVIANLEELPDLLVIDGGKGQLESARRALVASGSACDLMAVAKRPDRAFLADDRVIDLGDRDGTSLLLRRIRDEVHRFGIGFHRRLRDKRLQESVLEKVPGIGKQRRLELLRRFGSLDAVRKASVEEVAAVKGFSTNLAERLLKGVKTP